MRCWHALVLVTLGVGCATAVTDDGDPTSDSDAGSKPVTEKDSGTSFPTDSATTTTPDSGVTTNGCTAYQGALATFDFTGEPGNQTSTAATNVASGVTAGAITRATALTATSGADSMNSSAWGTTTKPDTTRYYTFSITPAAPCSLDIDSLSITTKSSGTGPANAAIATSADAFATTTSFAPNVTATPAVSVNAATGAVEVRVYGYGATAAGGTMRMDTTLTVSGALQ